MSQPPRFRSRLAGRPSPREAGWRSGRQGAAGPPSRLAFAFAALLPLATLQGCATLSESDCISADWRVMGEVDGSQGQPLSRFNHYRRDCAKYGIVPDTKAYTAGRDNGLKRYCTESNGYREGRSGSGDATVCPIALVADFQRGHELGYAVHTSLQALRTTNDSISWARGDIRELESDIESLRSSIDSGEHSEEEKRNMRGRIDSMRERISQHKQDIAVLAGGVVFSISQYRDAVEAARRGGYDEPMEEQLLWELQRLAR